MSVDTQRHSAPAHVQDQPATRRGCCQGLGPQALGSDHPCDTPFPRFELHCSSNFGVGLEFQAAFGIRVYSFCIGNTLFLKKTGLCPLPVLSTVVLKHNVCRADAVEGIGAALRARTAGAGQRPIEARLDRSVSTVRGWLRAFGRNAETTRSIVGI